MNEVKEYVDYKLRQLVEAVSESPETYQVTVRVPVRVRARLDVVAEFLHISRSALIVEILSEGSMVAFERLENNPILSGLQIEGRSPAECFALALEGKPLHAGMSAADYLDVGEAA